MTPVAAGLALGLGAGLVASRALGGLLFGVAASDPATYIATAVGVTAVALARCFVPALRASHLAAAAVLRGE